MSKQVFDTIIELIKTKIGFAELHVVLGGGEPTLHPHIFSMLGCLLGQNSYVSVWMATNGENKETVLGLLGMTGSRFSMRLSKTQYHYGNEDLTEAFTKHKQEVLNDKNFLPTGVGNAAKIPGLLPGCACNTTFFKPNGDVSVCGCPRSPVIGNVRDPVFKYKFHQLYVLKNNANVYNCNCYKEYPKTILEFIRTGRVPLTCGTAGVKTGDLVYCSQSNSVTKYPTQVTL